jgi:hypothetical protein
MRRTRTLLKYGLGFSNIAGISGARWKSSFDIANYDRERGIDGAKGARRLDGTGEQLSASPTFRTESDC